MTQSGVKVPRPARERAGYPNEGRLRGLVKPAQAGFVGVARPFTGRVWSYTGLCTGHAGDKLTTVYNVATAYGRFAVSVAEY